MAFVIENNDCWLSKEVEGKKERKQAQQENMVVCLVDHGAHRKGEQHVQELQNKEIVTNNYQMGGYLWKMVWKLKLHHDSNNPNGNSRHDPLVFFNCVHYHSETALPSVP